jgi:hypothetical protein
MPGHADFGGEVERVLSMVDSVLLLVDAMDGRCRRRASSREGVPTPPDRRDQQGRPPGRAPGLGAEPDVDLFDRLGATNNSDFPVVYASALPATLADPDVRSGDMVPLYESIMKNACTEGRSDGPFQMRISHSTRLRRTDRHRPHPARQGADEHGRCRRPRREEAPGPRAAGARLHGPERKKCRRRRLVTSRNIGRQALGIADTICSPDAPEVFQS